MATVQLVLDIEEDIAERAKKYANDVHTDLNKIINDYLQEVSKRADTGKKDQEGPKKKIEDFPIWIQELVLSKDPTPDFDHKAEYHKHLEKKYGL